MADRVRSMPPDTPHLMLVGELDGEPVADAFLIGKGIAQNGYAMGGVYVLPGPAPRCRPRRRRRARRRDRRLRPARPRRLRARAGRGQPRGGGPAGLPGDGPPPRVGAGPRRPRRRQLPRPASRGPRQAGFVLRPLPDDADEAAWHELYDLAVETWRDAPDAEGSDEELPYSVFRGFLPEPSYVLTAWRDGVPVGMTSVMDRAKDEALNTFFTGVRAEARGAGPLHGAQGPARAGDAGPRAPPDLHPEHGPERADPGGQRPARLHASCPATTPWVGRSAARGRLTPAAGGPAYRAYSPVTKRPQSPPAEESRHGSSRPDRGSDRRPAGDRQDGPRVRGQGDPAERRGARARRHLPDGHRRGHEGDGPVRPDDPGGVRRPGGVAADLRAGRRGDRPRLDERQRHHQHPLHRRVPAAAARHRRAEEGVPAADGHRRRARLVLDVRAGARLGRQRHHDQGGPGRRRLRHHRPEDVDHQRRYVEPAGRAGRAPTARRPRTRSRTSG